MVKGTGTGQPLTSHEQKLIFIIIVMISTFWSILPLLWLTKISKVAAYIKLNTYFSKRNTKIYASSPENSFRGLYAENMPEWLIHRCEELGYTEPTSTQKIALPVIFDGLDCILQSQTGSGKTLSFALPILSKIDPSRAAIQAVVIAPTRELGLQISAVLKQLAAGCDEKVLVMSIMEGSQNRRQQIWAVAEPPHIIVGNPKSLQRLVDMGRLRLNAVSFVVIDEVDASLLENETRAELHRLLSRHLSNSYQSGDNVLEDGAPMQENLVYSNLAKDSRDMNLEAYRHTRQTIMCSATIPQRQHFAASCLKNGWTETLPELIHVSPAELIPTQITHEYIECEGSLRSACLKYILSKELQEWTSSQKNSTEDGGAFQAMVFIEGYSYHSVETLIKSAQNSLGSTVAAGAVQYLSNDASLDTRAKVMNDFRMGMCTILLCGDGGARGLDIPGVNLIIQMSLPLNIDTYLHRAGRTGRLGRSGKVITLTSPGEEFVIQRMSNELYISIEKRVLKAKRKES